MSILMWMVVANKMHLIQGSWEGTSFDSGGRVVKDKEWKIKNLV